MSMKIINGDLFGEEAGRSAVFSACRRYRYTLQRSIGASGKSVVFLLHNPSSADETSEDPTSRRGIDFARRWGASRLIYVNVWAGVATKSADLWSMDDPCGPDNDYHITNAIESVVETNGLFVAAFGNIKPPKKHKDLFAHRLSNIKSMLAHFGCRPFALDINSNGTPKHPLYIRADKNLVSWPTT